MSLLSQHCVHCPSYSNLLNVHKLLCFTQAVGTFTLWRAKLKVSRCRQCSDRRLLFCFSSSKEVIMWKSSVYIWVSAVFFWFLNMFCYLLWPSHTSLLLQELLFYLVVIVLLTNSQVPGSCMHLMCLCLFFLFTFLLLLLLPTSHPTHTSPNSPPHPSPSLWLLSW